MDTAREVHVGPFQGPRQLSDSPCRLWVSLLAGCSEQTGKEGRLCLGSKKAVFIKMSLSSPESDFPVFIELSSSPESEVWESRSESPEEKPSEPRFPSRPSSSGTEGKLVSDSESFPPPGMILRRAFSKWLANMLSTYCHLPLSVCEYLLPRSLSTYCRFP